MKRDDIFIIVLMSSIPLFLLLGKAGMKVSSLLLFFVVSCSALYFHYTSSAEKYERMDFFPWNEVNIVKKRIPQSTVIDCKWDLDQKGDNLFKMSDPVVFGYTK